MFASGDAIFSSLVFALLGMESLQFGGSTARRVCTQFFQVSLGSWLSSFFSLYPCKECRRHAEVYVKVGEYGHGISEGNFSFVIWDERNGTVLP